MSTPSRQGHFITVLCAEHWDRRARPPQRRPWTITRFMGLQRSPSVPSLPSWRELPATSAQVQAFVVHREQHGGLPAAEDFAQADAENFLRSVPDNFTGGDKPGTTVRLVAGRPLIPGEVLTGTERMTTRHVLACPRCHNAGKKSPRLQLTPRTLDRLLDAVAGTGKYMVSPMRHEVELKALAALNGRFGQQHP